MSPASERYVVGIDLGGTKIRGGIAGGDGLVRHTHVEPTNPNGSGLVEQLAGVVSALAGAAGVAAADVAATVVGGAGVPDSADGGLAQAPNLSAARDTPLRAALEGVLGHRVSIENDVNVAAVGELHFGVGRRHRDFVFISIGTGIGMGVVVGGRLVRGARGAAGEIGYLPFGTDALNPVHQLRGPLEDAVAGESVVARYRAATGEELSSELVFARAAEGDSAAEAVVDAVAREIARAVVAVNAVLDPECFVLGGGIGSRPDLLARVRAWLPAFGAPGLEVLHSTMAAEAPVAGAVQLALDTLRGAHDDSREFSYTERGSR